MSDWNERLAQLKVGYAKKLSIQLQELLEKALLLLQGSELGESHLSAIKTSVHRLHGTAGTYGFDQVSQSMKTIEEHIRSLEQQNPAKLPMVWTPTDTQFLITHIREAQQASNLQEEPVSSFSGALISEASVLAGSSLTPIPPSELVRHRWFQTKLLVVDDSIDILRELEYFAQKTLNQVFSAQSVEAALEIACREELDGALIDVHLAQDQNGFALAEKLQQIKGKEMLPIIFFSADTRLTSRVEAARHNATFFFSKPLGINDFQFIINQITARKQDHASKVLFVAQDLEFMQTAQTRLEAKNLDVFLLTNPAQILETMEEKKPDVLLLDAQVSGISGFDLCRMLRAMPTWQHLPILFVTECQDLQTRLSCFRAGADDYLCKPLVFEELYTRIEMRLTRAHLLQAYADYDPLTGLLNRRAMVTALQRRIAEAQRYNHGLSLVMLDIDHFKQINDQHGHLIGDHVLASLGRMVSKKFRVEDLKSRWGGEEFCLAFYHAHPSQTQDMLQRFLERFRTVPFLDEAGRVFHVQFSAGIACFPQHGTTIEQLLHCADHLLYKAKSQGRNQILLGELPS